jgi:hypothetical protein
VFVSFVAAVEDAERAQLIADLKAARAELVARGRCRGELVDADGKVCAIGAIAVATVDGFMEISLASREISLGEQRPNRCLTALEAHLPDVISAFNDNSATTDQDVLDLFDKTLADLGGLA